MRLSFSLRSVTRQPSSLSLPKFSLKILIVDDHPLVRDVLAQTCRQLGWQAQAVDSVSAGLQALLKRPEEGAAFDLVLLDWHMPEMDGLAMLRKVHQTPALDFPPVVLMVALAEIERAVTASAEFNIDGIIAKPLTASSLLKAVTSALAPDTAVVAVAPPAIKKPLAGLHLLVAEDNELNREVIEQLLQNAGAQVKLVGNGQLAVDALQSSGVHFDAVLMDIQMPVMDGYTATHVLALFDVVTKAVGLRHQASPTAKTSNPVADLTLSDLNLEAALKIFGGNHERYGQLLHKFMAQQGNHVVKARGHLKTGNTKEAIALMHDLSGVAGSLQAPDLSRLAAAAEAAMLDEKTENLPLLFDEVQGAMDTVKSSLEQLEAAMA
jgi:CheY-like chemotaxis protein